MHGKFLLERFLVFDSFFFSRQFLYNSSSALEKKINYKTLKNLLILTLMSARLCCCIDLKRILSGAAAKKKCRTKKKKISRLFCIYYVSFTGFKSPMFHFNLGNMLTCKKATKGCDLKAQHVKFSGIER